jgi:hypothetical protein
VVAYYRITASGGLASGHRRCQACHGYTLIIPGRAVDTEGLSYQFPGRPGNDKVAPGFAGGRQEDEADQRFAAQEDLADVGIDPRIYIVILDNTARSAPKQSIRGRCHG